MLKVSVITSNKRLNNGFDQCTILPSATMGWNSDDFQFGQCMTWEVIFVESFCQEEVLRWEVNATADCLSFKVLFNSVLSCVILIGTSDLQSNPCQEGHYCLLFWYIRKSFSSNRFVCECVMFYSAIPCIICRHANIFRKQLTLNCSIDDRKMGVGLFTSIPTQEYRYSTSARYIHI